MAVIDSGVHAEHPHVGGVCGGIALPADGSGHSDYVDHLGHGTAVAAAIREKAPEAELFAVKVFFTSLSTSAAVLAKAIEWAARSKLHLINLSLGTPRPEHRDLLAGAVACAARAGVRVVAAYAGQGRRFLPGSLPGVIPVLLDWSCPRDVYRAGFAKRDTRVFFASGYPRDIPGVPRDQNLKGLSFAVANMTGFVARALETAPQASLQVLIQKLAVQAHREEGRERD